MIKYVRISAKDITPGERNQLYKLAYRISSDSPWGMRSVLKYGSWYNMYWQKHWKHRFDQRYANLIVAKDTVTRKIVGWATNEPEIGEYGTVSETEFYVAVFVNPEYRGKKIGKTLITLAAKFSGAKRILVYPHNQASRHFYQRLGATIRGTNRPIDSYTKIASINTNLLKRK